MDFLLGVMQWINRFHAPVNYALAYLLFYHMKSEQP